MTDQTQSLREDISFLRKLAEQGRSGPVLGGAFIAAAGVIYGAASFIEWTIATGRLDVPAYVNENLWYAASALFTAVWFALFFSLRRAMHATGGASNFTFGVAWAAGGIGILVALSSIAIVGAVTHMPSPILMFAPVDFAFYGTIWFVTAGIARRKWMFLVAFASFAVAPVLALLSGDARELLVLGVALIATLTLPGLKLMRETPAAAS